jgi:hypothetical protein
MRRILLLFLFAFPFFASAQTITATCKKLNVKEKTLDETHPATITITITDKQPSPGHYTLDGKYFVTICINDKANPNKTIYFNALDKNSKVKYVPAEYILGLPSSDIFLFTGIYEEPIMLYTANGSLLVAGFNEQLYVIEYPSPVIWNEFLKVAMESIDAKEQTDKTKIEPYQSTAVRDIRKKKDLTFDDIFYLGRENTTLKEFKRYYPFTHGSIYLGLSHTLYGHPVSDFGFSKDYKDFWHCSCYVYFGESKSKSAIDEANKFMQDIYAYLIKRGRNVTMTMGGNSSYPDCYFLKFNEGGAYHSDIGVVDGGLYHKTNGEAAWGVVIHMSYYLK